MSFHMLSEEDLNAIGRRMIDVLRKAKGQLHIGYEHLFTAKSAEDKGSAEPSNPRALKPFFNDSTTGRWSLFPLEFLALWVALQPGPRFERARHVELWSSADERKPVAFAPNMILYRLRYRWRKWTSEEAPVGEVTTLRINNNTCGEFDVKGLQNATGDRYLYTVIVMWKGTVKGGEDWRIKVKLTKRADGTLVPHSD
jgi:hypothetical protein